MRTILLVGKTGLGKTTFTNYLTGANNRTGGGGISVTTDPEETVFLYNGINCRVVDMPGFSDVRKDGQKAINDSTIHRWILEQVSKSEVVGVVMFVTQDDVLNSRLSREVIALMEIMTTRFVGYESMCFYAISGRSMPGDMHEFIRMSLGVVASGKLRVMGLSSDNWARCKNKDFSRVKSWCLQRLQSPEPRLVPRVTTDTCKRCGIKADPLIEISQCRHHGEPGKMIHYGATQLQHRFTISTSHEGRWIGRVFRKGEWTCCGKRYISSSCYGKFRCCNGSSSSYGCAEYCSTCGRETKQVGCKPTCRNCSNQLIHIGCLTKDKHDWALGLDQNHAVLTKHISAIDIQEKDVSEWSDRLDRISATDHQSMYQLFGEIVNSS